MKKDDLNKALSGYYRALLESSIVTGTVMHRDLSLSIMCMALFLTFTGLMLTQKDKMILSSNLVIIGIIIIVVILFLFFILSVGYYLYLRIHLHNIFAALMKIEKLQRDILFDKISQDELEKRFEEVYPFLNASKYKIKLKSLFRPF